jgi:hypothetical protein
VVPMSSGRRDPADDPGACSKCGTHIGRLRDEEYCEPCARELGAKPPMQRCLSCGRDVPQEQAEAIDVSPDDEYYPTIRYLCRQCSDSDNDSKTEGGDDSA